MLHPVEKHHVRVADPERPSLRQDQFLDPFAMSVCWDLLNCRQSFTCRGYVRPCLWVQVVPINVNVGRGKSNPNSLKYQERGFEVIWRKTGAKNVAVHAPP